MTVERGHQDALAFIAVDGNVSLSKMKSGRSGEEGDAAVACSEVDGRRVP